jgi:hypothetical protein
MQVSGKPRFDDFVFLINDASNIAADPNGDGDGPDDDLNSSYAQRYHKSGDVEVVVVSGVDVSLVLILSRQPHQPGV